MIDFDGTKTTTVEFASRYEGFGTPTLLFLSPRGDPLAPPKYGVPDIVDFYAYEIEETIRNLPPAIRRKSKRLALVPRTHPLPQSIEIREY